MAVLSEAERLKILGHICRTGNVPLNTAKPAVKAAVDAADDWVEANQASYVAALPSTFKTDSTATQKSLLLMYVLMRRMGMLRVEGD